MGGSEHLDLKNHGKHEDLGPDGDNYPRKLHDCQTRILVQKITYG